MRYGPDGNVYLIDWYDKQACHVGGQVDVWDRTNGRIYKISYRGTKPVTGVDLAKKSDKELVELLSDKNEWYVAARPAAVAGAGGEQEAGGRHARGCWRRSRSRTRTRARGCAGCGRCTSPAG